MIDDTGGDNSPAAYLHIRVRPADRARINALADKYSEPVAVVARMCMLRGIEPATRALELERKRGYR